MFGHEERFKQSMRSLSINLGTPSRRRLGPFRTLAAENSITDGRAPTDASVFDDLIDDISNVHHNELYDRSKDNNTMRTIMNHGLEYGRGNFAAGVQASARREYTTSSSVIGADVLSDVILPPVVAAGKSGKKSGPKGQSKHHNNESAEANWGETEGGKGALRASELTSLLGGKNLQEKCVRFAKSGKRHRDFNIKNTFNPNMNEAEKYLGEAIIMKDLLSDAGIKDVVLVGHAQNICALISGALAVLWATKVKKSKKKKKNVLKKKIIFFCVGLTFFSFFFFLFSFFFFFFFFSDQKDCILSEFGFAALHMRALWLYWLLTSHPDYNGKWASGGGGKGKNHNKGTFRTLTESQCSVLGMFGAFTAFANNTEIDYGNRLCKNYCDAFLLHWNVFSQLLISYSNSRERVEAFRIVLKRKKGDGQVMGWQLKYASRTNTYSIRERWINSNGQKLWRVVDYPGKNYGNKRGSEGTFRKTTDWFFRKAKRARKQCYFFFLFFSFFYFF